MTITALIGKIKSMNKKMLYGGAIGIVLILLGTGLLIRGKWNGYAALQKSEAPVSVNTMTVEPVTIDAVVSAAGALNSRNTSVLSSKVMGKVISLSVNEGDQVTQGKLLIRIESGEIAAQVYQAQAAYNNARLQYDRIKSLYDEKAATQMEMDQATLGFESAKAGLNAAKAMESYTIITAPINGRIVEKRIHLGEMALPGQPILKIEDNRNLRLEVTVKEQDLPYVQQGKEVSVKIDALPDKEIRARVGQIVPAADIRTHSFVVKIDIPSEKGLITGMYGKAFFRTGKRETILVPRLALVEMSGLTGVYIVTADSSAVFQMIQPGEIRGEMIEAVTGLKRGDNIVIAKQPGSIDGKKVVIVEK